MKRKIRNRNNGITLIALVITIVVMLILAAVSIRLTIGENGIVKRAKEAALMNSKAKYMEEINVEIADEKMERAGKWKQEPLIASLATRLSPEKKKWVKTIIKCKEENESYVEQDEDINNNILYIVTKEDYEIIVDVDNETESTNIRNSFNKSKKDCTVTYDKNGSDATGTVANQTIKPGFSVKLSECTYQRENYNFVGWCLDSEGTGEKLPVGERVTITEDTKIYAIWRKEVYTVTFEPNTNGIGNSYTQNIERGSNTKLTENTFTTTADYYFFNWNTKADGSGSTYSDKQTVDLTSDITLYAQWKTYYTVTYNGNNGTSEKQTAKVKQGVQTTTLASTLFTKPANKVFKGWNTNSNKSGDQYNPETNYTINSNLTLYAIWESANTLYSQISASNYGQLVNYSIDGCNNWKIFYKDSNNNVFMILGNCLEYSKFPQGTGISKYNGQWSDTTTINWGTAYTGADTYSGASAISSSVASKFMIGYVSSYPSSTRRNVKAIASIADTSKWEKFLTPTLKQKGALAIGSPSAEMVVASAKQKISNINITITYKERGASFNNKSYLDPWGAGYDSLYYPNTPYYAATPVNYHEPDNSDSALCIVSSSRLGCGSGGWSGTENWQNIFGIYYASLRPVICIPSNVNAGFDGTRWQLDI